MVSICNTNCRVGLLSIGEIASLVVNRYSYYKEQFFREARTEFLNDVSLMVQTLCKQILNPNLSTLTFFIRHCDNFKNPRFPKKYSQKLLSFRNIEILYSLSASQVSTDPPAWAQLEAIGIATQTTMMMID